MKIQPIALLALLLLLAGCNLPQGQGPSDEFATALALMETQGPPSATPAPLPSATPTPSGPPGQIVYTCQTTLNSQRNQLCLINPDGSGARQLTFDDTKDHFFASVAPEGASILFSSNRGGSYQIYELPLSGGEPLALTSGQNNFAPAVSPDGTTIVYTRNTGPELWDSELWLVNRDGSNPRRLTAGSRGGWDASWSPDGTQILFATHHNGQIQMAVVTVASGEWQVITDLTGLRGRNDWSINNLLSTYIGSPWAREIILFESDGSNVRYLTEGGNNLAPSFSPDGNWIVYTSYVDNFREDNGCEIYIMRVTGSDRRRLTENDYCDWQPRWGPTP